MTNSKNCNTTSNGHWRIFNDHFHNRENLLFQVCLNIFRLIIEEIDNNKILLFHLIMLCQSEYITACFNYLILKIKLIPFHFPQNMLGALI